MGASLCLALASSGCSKSESPESTAKPSEAANQNPAAKPGKEGVPMPKEKVPEASQILAAHVEAAGGAQAMSQIHSIYSEASLDVKAQALKGRVKSWWKDGQFYIEESIDGVGMTRAGFDGTRYWSDDPISQLRELSGAEAEQYAWASSMFLPAKWQEFFGSAKSIGARKVNDRILYDVELVTKGNEKVKLSFDKATKLMAEQSFQQISAMGKIPITVRLSDYRVVGGYKFPHRQELQTPILSGVQVYDKFEVNPEVPPERFAMPVAHQVVPADPQKQKIAKPPRR